MTDQQYEAWLATLTVVGDEAYLPDEEIPSPPSKYTAIHTDEDGKRRLLTPEEKRHYHRDRARRYRAKPEFRARERERRRIRAARRGSWKGA